MQERTFETVVGSCLGGGVGGVLGLGIGLVVAYNCFLVGTTPTRGSLDSLAFCALLILVGTIGALSGIMGAVTGATLGAYWAVKSSTDSDDLPRPPVQLAESKRFEAEVNQEPQQIQP